jgi:hypothetical protein
MNAQDCEVYRRTRMSLILQPALREHFLSGNKGNEIKLSFREREMKPCKLARLRLDADSRQ